MSAQEASRNTLATTGRIRGLCPRRTELPPLSLDGLSHLHLAKNIPQLRKKTAEVLSKANALREGACSPRIGSARTLEAQGGVNRFSLKSELLGNVMVIKSFFASEGKFISPEHPRGGLEN